MRAFLLAGYLAAACSDADIPPYTPPSADATPGSPDAFEFPPYMPPDEDDTWTWRARFDCLDYQTFGQYLDITLPLEEQTGLPSDSSISVVKKCKEPLSTPGGFWFRGFMYLSGGDDLVLHGDEWDMTLVPPRLYEVGPASSASAFPPTTGSTTASSRSAGTTATARTKTTTGTPATSPSAGTTIQSRGSGWSYRRELT